MWNVYAMTIYYMIVDQVRYQQAYQLEQIRT